MLGRQYLNSGFVSAPTGTPFPVHVDKILLLADEILNRMNTPDAVSDLSLPCPNQYPWPQPKPLLSIHFTKIVGLFDVPPSYTTINGTTKQVTCEVFYCEEELLCSYILINRVVHELTHGLRYLLVNNVLNTYVHIHPGIVNLFGRNMCVKPVRDRIINTKLVYMGHETEYDSGLWMEHQLLQGIMVWLVGSYYSDIDDLTTQVVTTPTSPGFFRLRCIVPGGGQVIRRGTDHDKLVGDLYDTAAHTFSKNVNICFVGKMAPVGADLFVSH